MRYNPKKKKKKKLVHIVPQPALDAKTLKSNVIPYDLPT